MRTAKTARKVFELCKKLSRVQDYILYLAKIIPLQFFISQFGEEVLASWCLFSICVVYNMELIIMLYCYVRHWPVNWETARRHWALAWTASWQSRLNQNELTVGTCSTEVTRWSKFDCRLFVIDGVCCRKAAWTNFWTCETTEESRLQKCPQR